MRPSGLARNGRRPKLTPSCSAAAHPAATSAGHRQTLLARRPGAPAGKGRHRFGQQQGANPSRSRRLPSHPPEVPRRRAGFVRSLARFRSVVIFFTCCLNANQELRRSPQRPQWTSSSSCKPGDNETEGLPQERHAKMVIRQSPHSFPTVEMSGPWAVGTGPGKPDGDGGRAKAGPFFRERRRPSDEPIRMEIGGAES